MQRKSSFLNSKKRQTRNGFAMIMAIFFMIIMATLLSYMLTSTTETAKRTTNDYVLEQEQLLAKSAVEYAILRVSAFDRSGADGINGTADDICLPGFTARYPETDPKLFDITVTINYFGFGDGCAPLFPVAPAIGSIGSIATPESNGSMLIDVYIENDAVGLTLSEPVRFHRRTLQKL
ncbi:hypothetical protein [Sulfurovum sp.]|uniref:hypothetical protein n=1 Tax=Sulfurovum sp. TaxID=1969726 RepID=UPI003568B7AC